MTIVAIHQPNYLPWLGFFKKIADADIFVFLDDVQYSKNSYTNRVKVLHAGEPRWLTLPVSFNFGDKINAVKTPLADWPKRHLDSLKAYYRQAPCFHDVWPEVELLYADLPDNSISEINTTLIKRICARLHVECTFEQSSSIKLGDKKGGERLVRIVKYLAPKGTYLSGDGGAKYQNENTFSSAGIELAYRSFAHPTYSQQSRTFIPGLSVLDAVFNIGWVKTADILTDCPA